MERKNRPSVSAERSRESIVYRSSRNMLRGMRAGVLALVLGAAGWACGRSAPDKNVERIDCKGQTADTGRILDRFQQIKALSAICWEKVQRQELECRQNFPNRPVTECFEESKRGEQSCLHGQALGVNEHSLRECGARIFEVIGEEGTDSFSFKVVSEDTDGDGVRNWHEYVMGTSPCDTHTYGNCELSDGDEDYDADGIPNASDAQPFCFDSFEADPGEYRGGCV